MLLFLGLICINALLYFAASSKRARRSVVKSQWRMRGHWLQLKETEKEEYEGLGMTFFLLPAIMLSGLILAMLVMKLIETAGG